MPGGFLERHARRGLSATAEALFPANGYGAPDHETTELVPRTLAYLNELPAPQRRLLLSLFALVELAAPLLVILGFSRFSRLPRARREEAVRAWRTSRLLPLRLLGDALKATTTMIYMSHPAALTFIGAVAACPRPADPLQVPVRPDAFGATRGAPG